MGATATAIVETRQRRQVPDILKPLVPDALESWLDTLAVPAPTSPDSPGRGNAEPLIVPAPNAPTKNIPAQNSSAPVAPDKINTSVDGATATNSVATPTAAPATPNP
jgi:hypothetical protein